MSYFLKDQEHSFISSLIKVAEDKFIFLATDLKRFFIEREISIEDIVERINENETTLVLPDKKIIKILMGDQPSDCQIQYGDELKISLTFTIKLKTLEVPLQTYFNLKEITSVSDIGEYFASGLLRTIIEQSMKIDALKEAGGNCDQVQLEQPNSVFNGISLVNRSNISDLCKMIGVEVTNKSIEETQKSQQQTQKGANATKQISRINRRVLKRPVQIERDFAFQNPDDSQEIKVDDNLQVQTTSTPITTKKLEQISKIPKKINVKF